MPSRWDYLFDQKPIPLKEHLFEEVSKLLAQELERWPLPVVDLDEATGRQFIVLLQHDSVQPAPPVYEEAFKLARWELEREVLAVDEYMRNQRWLERSLLPGDKQAILFISRWLVEQLLALREETQSRLSRTDLEEILGRIARKHAHAVIAEP